MAEIVFEVKNQEELSIIVSALQREKNCLNGKFRERKQIKRHLKRNM